jgi:RNA polymerase sigma-70 factor (ECF subfamily)
MIRMAQPATAEPGHELRRRFEELTLPHLKALYNYAVKLTGDAAGAQDLVQETYLKALQAFSTLRDAERVKPWLFQILSRLVTDRRRSASREVPMSPEELDRFSLYDLVGNEDPFPYSDHLHDDFLAHFRDDDIRAALRALPEAYRVPLVLLYTEGFSYKELAEVLACPPGTVMSRLHRGRKALERELWDCARRRGLVKTWKGSTP